MGEAMNYSDKIVEFLDGDLSAVEENELFSMLAADNSLRGELKSVININSKIRNSSEYYHPSPDITASIYKDLKIDTNLITPNISASARGLSKWNIFSGLLGGAVASMIFLTYIFVFSGNSEVRNVAGNTIDNYPIVSSTEDYQDSEKSFNSDLNSNKNSRIKHVTHENTARLKNTQNVIANYEEQQAVEDKKNISDLFEQKMKPTKTIVLNSNLGSIPLVHNNFVMAFEPNVKHDLLIPIEQNFSKSKIGLSLEINGMANWNLPKETIYPSELGKFNNSGVALFYDLSNSMAIGADLRQETFFVRYNGLDSLKQFFQYQQHSSFTSFGLTARYHALNLNDLKIFSQGNFSTNNYGIIARFAGGAEYYIYPDVSLSLLLEYSHLFFNHQNKWFDTRKIGINYGFNFKF